MSTYLACFIVSDFRSIEETVNAGGIGNNFPLRAFATPAQVSKLEFALETAKTVTEFYIQYFKEEYPLPKLGTCGDADDMSCVGARKKGILIVLCVFTFTRFGCDPRFCVRCHGALGSDHFPRNWFAVRCGH